MPNITEQEQIMRTAEADCHKAQGVWVNMVARLGSSRHDKLLIEVRAMQDAAFLELKNEKHREAYLFDATLGARRLLLDAEADERNAQAAYDHARRLLRIETDVYNALFGKAAR